MEKVSFPTKTKIAAWWMMIIIVTGILMGLIGLWFKIELWLCYIFSVFSIFLFPCLLLLRRKKLSWYWGVVSLSIIIILSLIIFFHVLFSYVTGAIGGAPVNQIIFGMFFYLSLFLLIIFLPPLVLLLIDRKNFWKVAT